MGTKTDWGRSGGELCTGTGMSTRGPPIHPLVSAELRQVTPWHHLGGNLTKKMTL